MYIVVFGVVWNPEAYYGHSSWAKWYPSPWVPNLFETMSHCPIDDSEKSQYAIACRTYMLFTAVKF